jgi:ABC-2 type transport system ATP-binding protein
MSEIISITNLNKSYGLNKAVDNLNLSIHKGDFFGFLGPNGAGKTTTIRMISGIIKADSGTITVNGLALSDKRKIASILGALPESRGFYDWMTATEYLHFFANLYGIPKNLIDEKVTELLTKVGLLQNKNKKIDAYSRGMKQRLSLARALINDPIILLLDEPTLGLDPKGQEDVQHLLKELNSKGVTIVYSSHLLDEVSNLCTRIGIINGGKLVADGTIDELMKKTNGKNLTEAFLSLTNQKT